MKNLNCFDWINLAMLSIPTKTAVEIFWIDKSKLNRRLNNKNNSKCGPKQLLSEEHEYSGYISNVAPDFTIKMKSLELAYLKTQ